MATFAQRQPRQFAPYIPEVDTQVYAQALAKKDQEYKLGASKVEAYRNNIAGLPVAFEHERKYLQGVTNELTSQINNMVGTDWSDQKSVNQVATQASTIYNDPNIQTMVGNAAHKRQQDTNLQEDVKASKGKNESNKSDYQNHLREFANNAKVGDSFDYNYFTHQDYRDDFSKWYKDKHPNSSIIFKDGSIDPKTGKYNPKIAAQEWDYIESKYKEISPAQVRDDWDNFTKTNPNYQKQIDIDANYEYRNLDNTSFAKMAYGQYQDILSTNKRAYDEADKQLDLIKADDPKRQQIQKDRDIAEGNMTDAFTTMNFIAASPDQIGEDIKKKTFRDNLSNMMAKRYSYLDMEDVSVGKTSPWEKQHELTKISNDNYYKSEDLKIKKEHLQIAERNEDLREQAATAKQRQVTSPTYGTVNEGGSSKEEQDYYSTFKKQTQDLANEILNNKNQFMFDQFGTEHSDWFENGIPTKNGEVKLNDLYNNIYNQFKSGNTKNLDPATLDYFNNNYENNKLWDAKNKALKEVDTEYDKNIKNKLDLDNKSINVNINGQSYKLTNKDVKNYFDLREEEKNNPLVRHIADPVMYSNDLMNTIKNNNQINRVSFRNDYFKSKNYLLQNQFQPIFDKKATHDQIARAISPYTARVEEGEKYMNKPNAQPGIVQDIATGKFNLIIKAGNESSNPIPITTQEAINLGVKDMRMDDYISQILRTNMNQIAHASSTYAKGTQKGSFSEAEPLSSNDKIDYRYGIRQVGNKYYVEFWQKNPNDDKDLGTLYKDKNGKDIVGVSTDLTDVKNMINNFKQTNGNSIKSGGEYYNFNSESPVDNNTNDNTLSQ